MDDLNELYKERAEWADIYHDHTVEENHAYGCRICGIRFDTFNSDDAIAAWNIRADLCIPTDERVKALVEAVARGPIANEDMQGWIKTQMKAAQALRDMGEFTNYG